MRNHFVKATAVGLLALAISGLMISAAGTQFTSAAPSVQSAVKVQQAVLNDTANGKSGSFIILLADQANVTPAYSISNKDARGWYVYNTLKGKADQTQGPIIALLSNQGVTYQSFWVANAIVVYNGSRALVDQLVGRTDVKVIESNDSFLAIEPPAIANIQPAPQSPNTVEWGVQNINAPAVWSMGYTGTNIVIGNADTGMQWDHPAIKPHYRGWNGTTADHNYNWHDSIHDSSGNPCGNDSQSPCDDYGHGTHTTGTTSGDDGAGNQIGVAPGAKWIGCRNMDAGNGTPARYTECFQFFIAPTDLAGHNPNPALRPDVINNSWGCPVSEGCAATTLQTIVENTQAAGVFVEASAGNSGAACSTVDTPPALYAAAFSSAAYDIGNNLAGFSSRGPVTADGSNRRKPDISGPGVNVRSSVPGNGYANESGTSMAGPHVVGAVALLWSARPQLERDITTTKTILENTANQSITNPTAPHTCGGIADTVFPNNHMGYGRVDVLAAVNSVPLQTPTPTVTGTPPIATPTNTPLPTNTTAPTDTPVAATNTPMATDTPALPTSTPMATNTPMGPTNTPAPTNTVILPTVTPTDCANPFVDITGNLFYTAIHYLNCRGVVGGLDSSHYGPAGTSTRGQFAKVVVLGFGTPLYTPTTQDFVDVPPSYFAYVYIESGFHAAILSGFDPATCAAHGLGNPCYLPNTAITRGQLTKLVVNAGGYTLTTPTGGAQDFSDVPPSNVFYVSIETAYHNGIIAGYPGGIFLPNANIRRDQMAQIVYEGIIHKP